MKKKLFTILLSVSLLFSLTGCAKEEPAKEPVKEVQTQKPPKQKKHVPLLTLSEEP